ncbi:MAG: ribosomal RNA small subunit methyltransferase A [Verrucomicrobia bacterium]|nr:ribosomal RNA small subunit methyltransferase A [Verrucomicrobiota bacterium]MCH8527383.1 16S rRNA (adenine(1518)-N(6)/adenine(1519)-N(6))-dimethyltransferase RsmA [Kiritimatiellia bacterium]
MDPRLNLTRPVEVRAHLRDIGFSPSKSMGQNFLIDAHMRDLILDASEVGPADPVIEVGPGLGVMTEGLLDRAASVLAIELDARLVQHLRTHLGDHPKLELRNQDATRTDWVRELRAPNVRVVSNLPYSVGSRILYDLAAPDTRPLSITVMVQSDVAERLLAAPGSDAYGLLTVRMSWAYDIKRVRNVPGACFLPPPRVGSTVVHFQRRENPLCALDDPDRFAALIKFAFTRRRKQLAKILRDFKAEDTGSGLDLTRRPETLAPEEWARLTNHLV